ncbi:MAG: formyltetrahydrofolate deformylase [Actinomycetota bacterium]|nr:formyltetrahydrofolate deformylase [Actinomycetota bacterium]
MSDRAVLLLSCPDRRGIAAGVAEAILATGGNIVHAEQHIDSSSGRFFQRIDVEGASSDALERHMAPVAERFGMRCDVRDPARPARVAVLASRQPHCLYDLLGRWRAGELDAEIPVVISNHPDHAEFCDFMGVPYRHLPVTPDTKADQEAELASVLAAAEVDLVVLARYMQILSPELVGRYRDRIINIHHSFLPAFVGAKPYHQAHERGVKVIGVTAHYATEDLDEGPIIDQDVVRVSHRDEPEDLVRKGRDLETVVLARAVKAHLEHRILVTGRRTVVFG